MTCLSMESIYDTLDEKSLPEFGDPTEASQVSIVDSCRTNGDAKQEVGLNFFHNKGDVVSRISMPCLGAAPSSHFESTPINNPLYYQNLCNSTTAATVVTYSNSRASLNDINILLNGLQEQRARLEVSLEHLMMNVVQLKAEQQCRDETELLLQQRNLLQSELSAVQRRIKRYECKRHKLLKLIVTNDSTNSFCLSTNHNRAVSSSLFSQICTPSTVVMALSGVANETGRVGQNFKDADAVHPHAQLYTNSNQVDGMLQHPPPLPLFHHPPPTLAAYDNHAVCLQLPPVRRRMKKSTQRTPFEISTPNSNQIHYPLPPQRRVSYGSDELRRNSAKPILINDYSHHCQPCETTMDVDVAVNDRPHHPHQLPLSNPSHDSSTIFNQTRVYRPSSQRFEDHNGFYAEQHHGQVPPVKSSQSHVSMRLSNPSYSQGMASNPSSSPTTDVITPRERPQSLVSASSEKKSTRLSKLLSSGNCNDSNCIIQ